MQNGIVTDGNALFYHAGLSAVRMEGAVILNVGIFPDDNLLVVGAYNGMIPDIGVVPQLYFSD